MFRLSMTRRFLHSSLTLMTSKFCKVKNMFFFKFALCFAMVSAHCHLFCQLIFCAVFSSGAVTLTQVNCSPPGNLFPQFGLWDDEHSSADLEEVFKKLESQDKANSAGCECATKAAATLTSGTVKSASLVLYSDSEDDEGQSVPSATSRFRDSVAEDTLEMLAKKTFAESTERKITWAVNLFRDWCFTRIHTPQGDSQI